MRLDSGAYAKVIDFLKGKEPPNIASAMFFVNRAPDGTNDCVPPLDGQPSVQQAIETEITAAFDSTPSMQTYFVVLDDDAHDATSPTGALTFFDKVRSDLPQAVQVLDATQTGTMQAAQTAAANFSKLVTQLGTCVYDYGLPAGTNPATLEVAFAVPGAGQTVVPADPNCNVATQNEVDGWSFDNGRLRICGKSCSNLRQAILASAAAALQSKQPAQDIPVTATILCSGSAPMNDAGPSADAGVAVEDASNGSDAGGSEDATASGEDGASEEGGGSVVPDASPAPPDASRVILDAALPIPPGIDGSVLPVLEAGVMSLP
jgi:hypothetical protein